MDRLGWAASTSVRIGAYVFGIRSNTVEADRALREILAAHIADGTAAPRNYSVQLHSADGATIRPMHHLFEACSTVHRGTHAEGVLRDLVRRLEELVDEEITDVLRLRAAALVREGRAVIAPAWVDRDQTTRRRLLRRGFVPIEGALVDLELGSGHVVVRPPRIVDLDALERWSRRYDARAGVAPRVPEGRYPVMAWAFVDGTGHDPQPTRAAAVVRAAAAVHNGGAVGARAAVATLAAAMAGATPVVLPRATGPVPALVDELASSAG